MSDKGKSSQVQSAQGINGVSRTPYKPTNQYNADGTPKNSNANASTSSSQPTNTDTGTVKTDDGNGGGNGGNGQREDNMLGGTEKMNYNTDGDLLNEGARVIREQKALREAQKNDPNYRSTTQKIMKKIDSGFGHFKNMAMGNRNKDKD